METQARTIDFDDQMMGWEGVCDEPGGMALGARLDSLFNGILHIAIVERPSGAVKCAFKEDIDHSRLSRGERTAH